MQDGAAACGLLAHLPTMYAALLLATLLDALGPVGPAASDQDPCASPDALPAVPACGEVPLCAARDRVRAACELRDAMESRYVFIEAKRELLAAPFDARARLGACAAAERAIAQEDEPLRFYDRMRRCLAAFEDGHLIVGSPARLPQVALGVGFRRAAGKVVVAWREPGLRKLAGEEVWAALPPGAEVLAVDGLPVAAAAQELEREVRGSSAGARIERALAALSRRDFAYPERRTVALTVAVGAGRRTVEIPWWVSPGAEDHAVARRWARRVGIAVTDLLPWFEDASRPRPGAASEGAPSSAPLFAGGRELREYTDEKGRVAVRGGTVARGGREVCYLQLLTFLTEMLSGPGGRRPFAEVVDQQVRACSERGLDLVLDLRQNEGGYLDHSTVVAEALAPAGASQQGGALVLRATERNEAVYRERAASETATGAPPSRRVLDAIGAARREGRPFTPAFVGGPISPRASVGGYTGRIVALIGPACMSACDRLAALLRASGRAVLVGGPTEGAGGSQQESDGFSATWTDSKHVLSVSIPNAAFGVQRAAAGPVLPAGAPAPAPAPALARRSGEVSFEKFFETFGVENRPIQPDVRYETQLEDVTGGDRGWLERVDAVLSGDPLPDHV